MQNFPKHVAIVMDGNRRWAKKRLMPSMAGHKAGATALKNLVEALNVDPIINHLTVYALSTENWNRDEKEINYLLTIMREYIDSYLQDSNKNNTKLTIIGERNKLPADLVKKIAHIEDITKNNSGLHLTVAINYGARDEIVRATKKLVNQLTKANININDLTQEQFATYLDTSGMNDPDLLIRTSGEKRISNFMLWQLAYTELHFMDVLWPDFTITHLKNALTEYSNRNRRYGE